ncbi:MAG: hypothetical protein K0R54_4659 [Clostridiaceae bacterium]|jgi:uncharacterized membrane protein YdjX (TVP38/TMEM64 family)|nr:hypothetical protein [Clostridiaceae bacterium]
MKFQKRYIILLLWVALIVILKKNNIITMDVYTTKKYLNHYENFSEAIFIGLWSVRLLAFIPGFVFMVLGGIYFGPIKGFLLSMIGITLSQSLIYVVSKKLSSPKNKETIIKQYPNVIPLFQRYKYKFLIIGIVCPIAPTDIICYLSTCMGISYRKYIATIVFINAPLVFIYSYVGKGFSNSLYTISIIGIALIFTGAFSIKVWEKMKSQVHVN